MGRDRSAWTGSSASSRNTGKMRAGISLASGGRGALLRSSPSGAVEGRDGGARPDARAIVPKSPVWI